MTTPSMPIHLPITIPKGTLVIVTSTYKINSTLNFPIPYKREQVKDKQEEHITYTAIDNERLEVIPETSGNKILKINFAKTKNTGTITKEINNQTFRNRFTLLLIH